MGHAQITNISQTVNSFLHKKPTSITTIVDDLERRKQYVSASEGKYFERHMLAMEVSSVLAWLYDNRLVTPLLKKGKQTKLFKQWQEGDDVDWDEEQYKYFDNILWRSDRKRLPIIHDITH